MTITFPKKTNFTRPSKGEDVMFTVDKNSHHQTSGICSLRWCAKSLNRVIWPPLRQRDDDFSNSEARYQFHHSPMDIRDRSSSRLAMVRTKNTTSLLPYGESSKKQSRKIRERQTNSNNIIVGNCRYELNADRIIFFLLVRQSLFAHKQKQMVMSYQKHCNECRYHRSWKSVTGAVRTGRGNTRLPKRQHYPPHFRVPPYFDKIFFILLVFQHFYLVI